MYVRKGIYGYIFNEGSTLGGRPANFLHCKGMNILIIIIGMTTAASNNLDMIIKKRDTSKMSEAQEEDDVEFLPVQNGVPIFFKHSTLPPCQLPLEQNGSTENLSSAAATATQLLMTADHVSP